MSLELDTIDRAYADAILQLYPDFGEPWRDLLEQLMASSRQGHLCLKVEASPQLPSCDPAPIRFDGDRLYLQRNWVSETRFLDAVKRLTQSEPQVRCNTERIDAELQRARQSGVLLAEQAEAIAVAALSGLTMITGGPGTGKTYTAGHLIRLLLQNLELEGRKPRIALAAPTGKAASQLYGSLLRSIPDEWADELPQARTLHSLLDVNPYRPIDPVAVPNPLLADLIVVDECSMIDAEMMGLLFASVPSGSRLVLLGDKDQLPPVESGAFFADMTSKTAPHCLRERTAHLVQCVRTSVSSLRDLAQAVCAGDLERAFAVMAEGEELSWHSLPDGEACLAALRRDWLPSLLKRFPDAVALAEHPKEALEAFGAFRILSPLRRGPFGVDALNRDFHRRVEGRIEYGIQRVEPILITSNDPQLDLYNGDVGVLVSRGGRVGSGDYALFPGGRRLSALLLPRYEYAYCLSVHKSQGSEYRDVVLLLPEGAEEFGRQTVYTAATRAKQTLTLLGSEEVIRRTIDHASERQSGLIERLTISPSSEALR